MIFNRNILAGVLAFLGTVALLPSCKKYDNPPPIYEELKPVNAVSRKVLVINIDGLPGSLLKDNVPANIQKLMDHGKYSFEVFKPAVATDASTLVSMLTGVPYTKHYISTDDYQIGKDPNGDDHTGVNLRRNVLDYIAKEKGVKTGIVTSNNGLREYLKGSNFVPVASSDVAVKDSTLSLLANQRSLSALFVDFRELKQAGDNGGYMISNAALKQALDQTDAYIGEIVAGIQARKNYTSEDWLIIVTSNRGGNDQNVTPGFMVVSQPSLKPREMKSGGFSSVLFEGKNIYAAVGDPQLFDAGDGKDFTVQVQIKVVAPSSGYVGFLSKGSAYVDEKAGWSWGTWQTSAINQWRNYLPGFFGNDHGNLSNSSWHTLTMTVKQGASTRLASYYYDGVLQNGAADNVDWKTFKTKSSLPLKIGWVNLGSGTELKFHVANLAYFQTALDATTINANLALKDITQHPNYNSLIGFWKMDEGAESTYKNSAPNATSDMSLFGAFKWVNLGVDAPSQSTFSPVPTGNITIYKPTLMDVTALMMYWMNVKVFAEYEMAGTPFLKDYEKEFVR